MLILAKGLSCLTILSLAFSKSPIKQTSDLPVLTYRDPEPINAKLIGGQPVNADQVPFLVAIRLRLYHAAKFGSGHICGGAIISQRVVCSAAHCFIMKKVLPPQYHLPEHFIVVGGNSLINEYKDESHVYLVERIIGHMDYVPSSLENDIALVFLNRFIPWKDETMRAACLPKTPPNAGTNCVVLGWRKLTKKHIFVSIKQAMVPLLSHKLCSSIYAKMPLSQMCAGYMEGGVDACDGDSGGPMFCEGELAGVVTWGYGCAVPGFPGVYTNVSYYLDWIAKENGSLDYSHFADMRSLISAKSLILYTNLWFVPISALISRIF